MSILDQLTYVRIGVPKLSDARAFATEILGLEDTGFDEARAYFRSDLHDFNLCFEEGGSERSCVAFQVHNAAVLERAYEALCAAGRSPRRGGAQECLIRRVKAFIAFSDHSGNPVELVLRPQMSGWRAFPTRDSGIRSLQSVSLRSTDILNDELLWTDVLGAKVSDWVGDGSYLRIDDLHNRLALYPSNRGGMLSLSFSVDGIDQIMQTSRFLRDRQCRVVHGPGRDPASGEIFVSVEGPGSVIFRLATGMASVADNHRPRQFPHKPSSYCVWGSEALIPEFN